MSLGGIVQGRLRRRVGLTVLVAALAAQVLGLQPAFAATPTLTTQATNARLGQPISDTATLAGGDNPTGTITFRAYGPNDPTCAGPASFTPAPVTVSGNGNYNSGSYIPTAPGDYRWTAAYAGDANNTSVATLCNDAGETSVVSQATPTVTTQATTSASLGQPIQDKATIVGPAGVTLPTGTVLFIAYGPNDPNCSAPSAYDSLNAVGGGSPRTATSDPFFPPQAGTYRWIAQYSGDSNYEPFTTGCNEANESSVVSGPSITVSKTATPTTREAPGGTFTYNVVVTNTGPQSVTITSLIDNEYGNLTLRGTCTNAVGTKVNASPGPGNSYNCSFSAPFMGVGGDSLTDRVTATVVDDLGNTASAFGDATVTITPIPAKLIFTKTPLPPTLPEPGGNYVTALVIKNLGGQDVTITDLTDNVYGDITDLIGTCKLGTVVAAGDTYECFFVTSFIGVKGTTQTNTLTLTVIDGDDTVTTFTDTATVRIVDPLPEIDVQFSASPANRPAPGGFFTFTVAVRNTGKSAVTLAALLDDVDGYLGAKGSCPYTASIPVGATFTCTFADEFRGSPGDVQLRTVRAIVNNIDGNSAIDNDDALISLTGGPTNGPSAVVARDSGPALVVTGNAGTPSSGSGGAFTPANVPSAPSGLSALSPAPAPAGARSAGSSGPAAPAIIGSARPGTSASAGTGASPAAVPIPASASRAVVASSGGNLSGAGTAAAAMLMMGLSLIGAGQIWRRFHP